MFTNKHFINFGLQKRPKYEARHPTIYYLVNFIDQNQRVSCSYSFKALYHLSWHGTNVGSTMPLHVILKLIYNIAACGNHQYSSLKRFPSTLISATSVNPPTENRKKLRFMARAIERPMLVFPTPGGPPRQMIFPVTYKQSINNPCYCNDNSHSLQALPQNLIEKI